MTLAQVLAAGNDAGGLSIINLGSLDTPAISNAAEISISGGGGPAIAITQGATINEPGSGPTQHRGNAVYLNDGSGTGAGPFKLDAAIPDLGTLDGTTPVNQATPAGWWHIQIMGVDAWIPYYQ